MKKKNIQHVYTLSLTVCSSVTAHSFTEYIILMKVIFLINSVIMIFSLEEELTELLSYMMGKTWAQSFSGDQVRVYINLNQ